MSDDRYKQIFEDLTRDLYAVAKRHGKRALREAVRDAARGELLQEEEDENIPPEELDYPDEDVWTLPPPPDERDEDGDERSTDDEHELSDAAEKVLDRLMDRLKKKAEK